MKVKKQDQIKVFTGIRKSWKISPITRVKSSDKKYKRIKREREVNHD